MVFQLDDKLWFPNPALGDSDGMLAVGGDLSVDRLLLAYSYGIFPWYDFRNSPIQWWCPLERFVIFPSEIHISHSMRTLINKGKYVMSFNQAFDEVIKNCGNLRIEERGAWMFSLVPSASKLALIFLANIMKENGGVLIDCQFETPHLKSMGGKYIPYDEYIKYLRM